MPSETAKKLMRLARNLRKQDTWAEKLLWRWLRDRRFSAYKFRRQHTFGPYILDFFCVEAFLNIELDGSQHGFPEQKRKDEVRDAWLTAAGVTVLRFWNSRLKREQEFIRETIWRELQARAPHPLPDYCRPMGQGATNGSNATGKATRPFPSPQPSPLGRGRIVSALAQKPAAGFAGQTTEQSNTVRSPFPLPMGVGQGKGKRVELNRLPPEVAKTLSPRKSP